ncbi:MAG TPA: hypothetical protein VK211_03220 [Kamptonema sp.]|nr:hypothetical protein [Kamptonema sp.]
MAWGSVIKFFRTQYFSSLESFTDFCGWEGAIAYKFYISLAKTAWGARKTRFAANFFPGEDTGL